MWPPQVALLPSLSLAPVTKDIPVVLPKSVAFPNCCSPEGTAIDQRLFIIPSLVRGTALLSDNNDVDNSSTRANYELFDTSTRHDPCANQ
mmetsp:Transcript_22077/g.35456  ORF Transcript_22077/g.35456 Transcript_22077/m.35456 type:complete len:90 (+) Transcript_22077:2321-2590(+)